MIEALYLTIFCVDYDEVYKSYKNMLFTIMEKTKQVYNNVKVKDILKIKNIIISRIYKWQEIDFF